MSGLISRKAEQDTESSESELLSTGGTQVKGRSNPDDRAKKVLYFVEEHNTQQNCNIQNTEEVHKCHTHGISSYLIG